MRKIYAGRASEIPLRPELNDPRRHTRLRDRAEAPGRDQDVGIREVDFIEQVEILLPQPDPLAADREVLEDPQVDLELAGTCEQVALRAGAAGLRRLEHR